MSIQAFYFYAELDKPLNEIALNLQDLRNKIGQVPVASLEFHQKRGDFAKWIRDVLNDTQLAENIQNIEKTGADLKEALLKALYDLRKAACPRCGIETIPIKIWNMAGRPNKVGNRLQLTIGHYKCLKCNTTFRRTLAKTKISFCKN